MAINKKMTIAGVEDYNNGSYSIFHQKFSNKTYGIFIIPQKIMLLIYITKINSIAKIIKKLCLNFI